MPKVKKFIHGINQFFRNLVAAESFAEVKEKVEKQSNAVKTVEKLEQDIKGHDIALEKIASSLDALNVRLNNIDDNITNLRQETRKINVDIDKVKTGLQEEIGESLEHLYRRCVEKQYATLEEKHTA